MPEYYLKFNNEFSDAINKASTDVTEELYREMNRDRLLKKLPPANQSPSKYTCEHLNNSLRNSIQLGPMTLLFPNEEHIYILPVTLGKEGNFQISLYATLRQSQEEVDRQAKVLTKALTALGIGSKVVGHALVFSINSPQSYKDLLSEFSGKEKRVLEITVNYLLSYEQISLDDVTVKLGELSVLGDSLSGASVLDDSLSDAESGELSMLGDSDSLSDTES